MYFLSDYETPSIPKYQGLIVGHGARIYRINRVRCSFLVSDLALIGPATRQISLYPGSRFFAMLDEPVTDRVSRRVPGTPSPIAARWKRREDPTLPPHSLLRLQIVVREALLVDQPVGRSAKYAPRSRRPLHFRHFSTLCDSRFLEALKLVTFPAVFRPSQPIRTSLLGL